MDISEILAKPFTYFFFSLIRDLESLLILGSGVGVGGVGEGNLESMRRHAQSAALSQGPSVWL